MKGDAITGELSALKVKYRARDARMTRIATARLPGGLRLVYPDLFPDEGPYMEPMVANMLDVAARDTSEVLAPPPAFNCGSAMNATDKSRAFADRRTRIAYGYFDASNLSVALLSMADQYVTYGFSVGAIRVDQDRKTPVVKFLDPMGCYPIFDMWGSTRVLYECRTMTHQEADSLWPEVGNRLRKDFRYSPSAMIEIVRRHDGDSEVMFTPLYPDMTLMEAENPIGETLVHTFTRPGPSDEMVGQFDDVLAVQVAKARFALLTLEAAQKSVQAPIAMPIDVQEVNTGADATIRSQSPEKIRRVGLDVPQAAFIQQQELDQELRTGARYPQARTGNVDASVVTGRGVQALMSGFDTQMKTGQAVFALGLGVLFSKAFKVDEALWPSVEKTVNGNMNGTPYTVKYKPARDINGDHTIDVSYGLMAGLAPNQALVFGLQARGDRLISRDFLRRQLPFSLDAENEETKVDVETLRESLLAAFSATAQAVPAMAQQGGDPSDTLSKMSQVIALRQRGKSIEDAIKTVFVPPTPPPGAAPAVAGGPPPPATPEGQAMVAGGGPEPGPVGPNPGQERPDVMQLMASLGRSGANLNAAVQRRVPIP